MPALQIPPPVGLGDLAILLQVLGDKAALKRHMDDLLEAHKRNEKIVAVVGKAEDIERLHAEANLRVAEATATAARMIEQAHGDVAQIHAAAERKFREAEARMGRADEVEAAAASSAAARDVKSKERENAVTSRETECSERERLNEARSAELGQREVAVASREAAAAAREAKLRAAIE